MSSSEAHEMYTTAMIGNGYGTNMRGFKADIRDYARWEYGQNDAAWLLALAAVRRRPPRRILRRLAAWLREDIGTPPVPAAENQGR